MLKIKVEFEGEVVSRIFRTFNFSFSTGRLLVEVDSAVSPMGDTAERSGDGHEFSQPAHL